MKKNISSMSIALLLFVAIFGITNIPANYAQLGNSSIGWFILLSFYFIPLAFIIGELSSQDTSSKSGMFGWISLGLGEKWAFLGTWAYFIVNIFYLPLLASRIPVLFSWTFTADITSLDQVVSTSGQIGGVVNATDNHFIFLFLTFITFIIALVLGIFFDKVFSSFAKFIGWLSLAVTAIFITLALLAVPVFNLTIANPLTFESIVPTISPVSLSTFAWILFAIAGIETVGSYTPYVHNAKSKIPKAIVLGAILVISSYIIGFIAIAFVLTPSQVPVTHMENMIPIMYAQVGYLWGFGPLFLRIMTFSYLLITITALVLWLNATVTSLFADLPKGILNKKLTNKKINNIPLFGLLFTGIMVLIFLIISTGTTSSNIYTTLYDMTTIAVLVPYILIAISYVAFCFKKGIQFNIIKNKKVGSFLGVFVFVITFIAMVFSIFDLTTTSINELIGWAILSGGGLLFFLSMGFGIYKLKTNRKYAYTILFIIFTISTLLFSIYLIILPITFLFLLLKEYK